MKQHLLLHPFNGLFSRTTWVSWYQNGKTSLNINEARDDGVWGWQWHQLDHMQTICISLQTDNTHTYTRLTALCSGLPGRAGTRKTKPIWILLKQETVSGSGISWAVCKSAPRQITTPATHHSVFNRMDALPAVQPTASKH